MRVVTDMAIGGRRVVKGSLLNGGAGLEAWWPTSVSVFFFWKTFSMSDFLPWAAAPFPCLISGSGPFKDYPEVTENFRIKLKAFWSISTYNFPLNVYISFVVMVQGQRPWVQIPQCQVAHVNGNLWPGTWGYYPGKLLECEKNQTRLLTSFRERKLPCMWCPVAQSTNPVKCYSKCLVVRDAVKTSKIMLNPSESCPVGLGRRMQSQYLPSFSIALSFVKKVCSHLWVDINCDPYFRARRCEFKFHSRYPKIQRRQAIQPMIHILTLDHHLSFSLAY